MRRAIAKGMYQLSGQSTANPNERVMLGGNGYGDDKRIAVPNALTDEQAKAYLKAVCWFGAGDFYLKADPG